MTTPDELQAQWDQATQAVSDADTILVVAHLDPDGDAIGSLLGLGLALREKGKLVTTALDDAVPDYLRFLPGVHTIIAKLDSGAWDVMISTDCSDEERSGSVGIYGRTHSQQVINLDHHPTNTRFGDIFLVVPQAVSSTEIVFDWLERMGQPLTQHVATLLLNGLVTDTLGFRTNNVTPRTLDIARQLMAAGAPLHDITARTLDNKPYSMVNLWKYVLSSMQLEDGVISAVVTQQDLQRAGLDETVDSGALINLLVNVEEAVIAVVFKEISGGEVKISLRCKPGYDVSQVAFALGGGGHKQASGATLAGSLEAVRARVMPLLCAAAAPTDFTS